jgi:hypothetical protein
LSDLIELKAILPIAVNEEVTACYLDDHTELYDPRQSFLLENWGFNCRCERCPTSRTKSMASDKCLARYRVIRERYIGHDNSENWEILGFPECWAKMKEGIRLMEVEERYGEVAQCWESLFRLAVGWGEHAKALEAGKGWVNELVQRGQSLDDAEMRCLRDPETVAEWCRFTEVAEIEVRHRWRRNLMNSSRRIPRAMERTISNRTGLPPKGAAFPGKALFAGFERDLTPQSLRTTLVPLLFLMLALASYSDSPSCSPFILLSRPV